MAETRQADVRQGAPASACAQYSLPPGALNDPYAPSERPALLTIRTGTGLSYLVKLESLTIDLPPLLYFLEGGQSVDVDVPLGEFRLKYATGTHRCGTPIFFGEDTAFSEANDTLTFEQNAASDTSATHLTVELPLQADGKVMAKSISRNEFYRRQ